MAMFGPAWWHHHGTKMRRDEFHPKEKLLAIVGSAATLKISKSTTKGCEHYWQIEWEVRQSLSEFSAGVVLFTNDDLSTAFGLKKVVVPSHSTHLIRRYGGDRAFQGKYFGSGDYLNIPMPGTGHDGDPNISIDIDDAIKDAIRQLLI